MATGTRLYVGNLSFRTTESTLRAAFEQGGRRVAEIKIVTDRETGQPRGFAFVEMGSPADAQAAIADWNGQQLDGRTLKVNEAQERSGGGGGRGGGGYGGDRGGYGGDRDRGGYGGDRDRGGYGGDRGGRRGGRY
jgi:RNA recognition motif-containing protein